MGVITKMTAKAKVREMIKGSDSLLSIPSDPLPWEVDEAWNWPLKVDG
jgi:hypothetical protein